MRTVTVVYHCEDGNWWSDSAEHGLETFVAGGRSFEETRRLTWEGVEFHLGERVALNELYEDGRPVDQAPRAVFDVSGPDVAIPAPATSRQAVPVTLDPAEPLVKPRPVLDRVA
jgi:hypothetical protein